MKKLSLLLCSLLVTAMISLAQVPQGVSYQAVARNSAGAILASQPVGLRFSIHDATATGAILYQETFNVTTTPLGLFSVNVGTGTVAGGVFSNINWSSGPKYLQVEMDASGGTAYLNMGIAQQMMSVPYSLYSENGIPNGTVAGDILYWNGTGWVRIPTGTPGQVLTIGSDGMPGWSGALLPSVTTGIAGSITGASAAGGGNVSSAGGTSVTAYGICWSTAPGAESVSGMHTIDGSGTGSFISAITGLSAGTTYYIRAYATNSMGTAYGNEISFSTLGDPVLTTAGITGITTSSGIGGGNVSADGGAAVTAYGVCWSTSPGAESATGMHSTDGAGTGSFTSNITGLASGTAYYVKAYATSSVGTAYGAEVSFTTNAIVVPSLTTAPAGSITSSGATTGGNVSGDGGAPVSVYGVCWSITPGAESVSGMHTTDGSGTGSFSSMVSGLNPGTTYYVRSYATNSAGTAYGNEISFSTNAVVASLSTANASGITSSAAATGGNISSDGGATVTARGVCWGTVSGTESISGMHTADGSGSGNFNSNITGLTPGTTYFVMAYATNSAGTAYGTEISFTTNAVIPTLTTTSAGSITYTGAVSGGNVSNDGGATVTASGVCWSTTSGAESVAGMHTTDGSGTGSFTSNITGLTPGTTYYVRGYAANSAGTAYGTEVSFTTTAVAAPVLTTSATSGITSSGAISGGNITGDGGAAITAYGVCWSTTSGAESVAGVHTTDGSGTGSFTSNIAGLAPGTMYYVMAYATNSAGTAYGTEVSFTTAAVVPTLTTTGASSITSSGATTGGNVTATGGATVTAYGVCWSTASGTESVSGAHTTDGSGTGSFTSNITGLTPGATYYVMSYATNSTGTAYGSEITFTTSAAAPTVTTVVTSSITNVSAVSGGNVTSDGGAAVTAYGVCWSATSGTESVSGDHTADGTGTGSFTSAITGLTATTTYFVKSYATNSAGTTYGNEVSFTTSASLLPVVVTGSITGITSTSFTASGNVTSIGGAPVTDRGIIGGFSPGLTLATGYVLPVGAGIGSFDTTVTGVPGSSTLYIKAYATNSYGTVYGTEVSLTTLPPVAPTVSTDSVKSISGTSAMGYGHVPDDGGDTVINSGFCWSTTSGGESLSGPNTSDHGSTFSSYITGLTPGTTYYIKSYATTAIGTSFGSEISFTTSASLLPIVVTYGATSVTSSSFTLNGEVTSEGGSPVTDRGFVGGLTSGPTLTTGSIVPAGTGAGIYNFTITRSSASTTYFIRSYATNSYGTVYGNENTVTTLPPSLATVATVNVTSVTATSAVGSAIVSDEGGVSVTARGVCWSTTPGGESASGLHTTDGTGTGTTTDFISGLTPGTTYYVMAYATNSVGTAYGSEVNFTTSASLLPTVITYPVSGITSSSFTLNGNVTSDGGYAVTAYGFAASLTPGGESLSGISVLSGSGTGIYSSTITNASGSVTYYLKAYATNSNGTTFGNEVLFSTLPPVLATVTTSSITAIAPTSANGGGNLVDAGGANITERGVCWSTTPGAESASGAHSSGGGGTGPFTSFMSALSSGTTYYVKAYAISSVGTAYGSEVSFTTTTGILPGVLTTGISGIGTGSAIFCTGNVVSSGSSSVYDAGFCWSTNPGAESISGSHSGCGSGTGNFTCNPGGFTTGTLYLRAYATSAIGTSYGNEISFVLGTGSSTFATTGVNNITSSSALSGGYIPSGTTTLSYGVCWSTSPGAESVSGAHTTDGTSGSGSYTSTITGISTSNTYYVRAYMTSSSGTVYGSEIRFNTP